MRGLGVAYILKAIDSGDASFKSKAVDQWRLSLQINPRQERRNKLLGLIRKYSQ